MRPAPGRTAIGAIGALVMALAGCAAPSLGPKATLAATTHSAEAVHAAAALVKLADGVYVHRGVLEEWAPGNQGDVSNAGIVIGQRCVAVIDTGGTVAVGRRLVAAIREITSQPVCYVISTHAHPDHVLGHQAFVDAALAAGTPAPQFIGHTRLPAALSVRGPFYLNALRRDFSEEEARQTRIVMPTTLVKDTLDLDLGGRKLSLKAWPTAHTDADLSVFDEQSRTLFMGDLLFIDHTPVLDGRIKGWLAAMGILRSWPVGIVVPGHGAPQHEWPDALDAQARYLERLQADVRAALAQRLTLSQAVARIAPNDARWRLLDVFHQRNVTAAYAELEWED